MMVTHVRGAFKNVYGTLDFDPDNPRLSSVEATIEASGIWTGQSQRDAHLRSADFLDVEHYPQITYKGAQVEVIGDHDYVVAGVLAIRGVTRPVSLRVTYLGQWQTPWWEEEDGAWIDKGPKLRAGFVAKTEINRYDFGVSWNDAMDKGGFVVGEKVSITIDVEAIWESN